LLIQIHKSPNTGAKKIMKNDPPELFTPFGSNVKPIKFF
jgi:hypothetical protein